MAFGKSQWNWRGGSQREVVRVRLRGEKGGVCRIMCGHIGGLGFLFGMMESQWGDVTGGAMSPDLHLKSITLAPIWSVD